MSPFVSGAVKVSVVVLAGIAATALLRRQSAAARHWALSVAIACATAMPLLGLVVPSWQLTAGASRPAPPVTRPSGDTNVQVEPLTAIVVGSQSQGRDASNPENIVESRFRLGVIWIAGMVISLGILLVGVMRLRWLASRARRIDSGKWTELAREIARTYGLRRPIRFLETEHPTLLITWGILRPTVMMPAAAREWPEDRIRVVLSHELAHVRRADWVVQIGAELLRAVYWFNPLLWIACRSLRQESERACDDAVLSTGVTGNDYATHLVDLARLFSGHRRTGLPALHAISGPSNLERRIIAMLNVRLNRRPLTWSARTAAVIALVSLTLPVAGFGAQTFATLSGTIADQTGALVPNTTVTIMHAESRTKHEVQSNATGYFQFVGLAAGDYRMEVQAAGFSSLQEELTLAPGQAAQRTVVLRVGSIQETISVVSDATSSEPLRERPRPRGASPKSRVCEPSAIGGRIVPPTKIYDVKPHFPQANAGGRVVLDARIGTDGTVTEVRAVPPVDVDLESAAKAAVSQWEFTPTLLNCVPVEVNMKVSVSFSHQ